ncbi:hypothetical protein Emed_001498 [Eimeria media]
MRGSSPSVAASAIVFTQSRCLALKGWQPTRVTSSSPQLSLLSRVFSSAASRPTPDFLSVLNPLVSSAKEDALASGVLAGREATRAAPSRVSRQPSCSPDCTKADDDKLLEIPVADQGNADLRRLQDRYDMLLRHPQAFARQVQLLRMHIQRGQQLRSRHPSMRELLSLQDKLSIPGTGACLVMKPVVYAAFDIYCPSYVHINATARVGAAVHFLNSYLNRKSLFKRRRFDGLSSSLPHGVAGAEQWLAQSSLENICVYPLEALPPQSSIFRLSAPLRVAAWEELLGSALSC